MDVRAYILYYFTLLYIHTYLHTYILAYSKYSHSHTYMLSCLHIYTLHTLTLSYFHICALTYLHTHIYTQVYRYIDVYIYISYLCVLNVYTLAHTHSIYIYVYIYVHIICTSFYKPNVELWLGLIVGDPWCPLWMSSSQHVGMPPGPQRRRRAVRFGGQNRCAEALAKGWLWVRQKMCVNA